MNIPSQFHSTSKEQTQQLGEQIAEYVSLKPQASSLKSSFVLCLYGELGSGKTTFTQGFAKGLGYITRLLSPTFLIMRSYDLPDQRHLYHLDLYRVQADADYTSLGIREVLAEKNAFVVIEWPEKMASLLPEHRLDITFQTDSEQQRTIIIDNSMSF